VARDYEATPETALVQALAAFGHGVGGLDISHGAAKVTLDRFRPVIEKGIGEWDGNLPSLIAYATMIGRATAHHTLSRGAATVTARDFLETLKQIGDNVESFLGCPFSHHHH
jgi:hypothetical protein